MGNPTQNKWAINTGIHVGEGKDFGGVAESGNTARFMNSHTATP